MKMKKEYIVSAKGTEYLAEAVIEANTPEEAEENYRDAWSNGEISASGYEFSNWHIVEINSCEENKNKTYLAKFTIIEGEHEHHAEFLLTAKNHDEAFELAKSQEHEPEIPDENEEGEKELTHWDYGDGTTASRLQGVVEITEEEAATINRLGLAHYFEYKKKEERERKRVKCVNTTTFEDCLTVGKYYDVAVEKDGGGKDMDMYYLLDDNNEPLNTLSYHFAE